MARPLGCRRCVGYLAVGLAVSPFTPGYVADRDQLQVLADVGVVLLLFEVGIEIDVGAPPSRARGRSCGARPCSVAHDRRSRRAPC